MFQLSGANMPYDAYTASPVHRFFQMWQQTDCNADYATKDNPSGCLNDLFPWVEDYRRYRQQRRPPAEQLQRHTTGEGSTSMAFYNMAQGDAPYFKELADKYTINDNFHQSVMGGTGANHIMFGFGDAIFYTNSSGVAATSSDQPDRESQPTGLARITTTTRTATAAAAMSIAVTSASQVSRLSPTTSSRSSGR